MYEERIVKRMKQHGIQDVLDAIDAIHRLADGMDADDPRRKIIGDIGWDADIFRIAAFHGEPEDAVSIAEARRMDAEDGGRSIVRLYCSPGCETVLFTSQTAGLTARGIAQWRDAERIGPDDRCVECGAPVTLTPPMIRSATADDWERAMRGARPRRAGRLIAR